MTTVEEAIASLPERHRSALEWFRQRAGTSVSWPEPLEGETRLVTQAKGIYKPEWTKYALSVRETLESPYRDREPIVAPDGSWIYFYHQEGHGPGDLRRLFTNQGLMACAEDRVPIGVLRQLSATGPVRYEVLGVGFVTSLHKDFFRIESAGIPAYGTQGAASLRSIHYKDFGDPPNDDPAALQEFAIRVRRGQRRFRQALLALYAERCAVSNTGPAEVLEAVHITPHATSGINALENGLLLRADLHTLFDEGLMRIEPSSLEVHLAKSLQATSYWPYHGTVLRERSDKSRPSRDYLAAHWHRFA